MKNSIYRTYFQQKEEIKERLEQFKALSEQQKYQEFLFCLLTPQSNAKKCWEAVKNLEKLSKFTPSNVLNILKSRTRFHHTKTKRILQAPKTWKTIQPLLSNPDRLALRNQIAETVNGYGLKEASHFLRNIGLSENQIAILDRHILKNLEKSKIIPNTKIRSPKHYLEIEQKFKSFSNQVKIPVDELDLLFWSKENGEIFK